MVLPNRDRREVLEMGAAPPPPRARPPEAAPAAGIRAVGDHEYRVSRRELERVRANLETHAGDARIVPIFLRGTVSGFKIFSIRPGSIFQRKTSR